MKSLHAKGLLPPARARPLQALGAFEAYRRNQYPPKTRGRHRLWNRSSEKKEEE